MATVLIGLVLLSPGSASRCCRTACSAGRASRRCSTRSWWTPWSHAAVWRAVAVVGGVFARGVRAMGRPVGRQTAARRRAERQRRRDRVSSRRRASRTRRRRCGRGRARARLVGSRPRPRCGSLLVGRRRRRRGVLARLSDGAGHGPQVLTTPALPVAVRLELERPQRRPRGGVGRTLARSSGLTVATPALLHRETRGATTGALAPSAGRKGARRLHGRAVDAPAGGRARRRPRRARGHGAPFFRCPRPSRGRASLSRLPGSRSAAWTCRSRPTARARLGTPGGAARLAPRSARSRSGRAGRPGRRAGPHPLAAAPVARAG